MVCCYGHKVAAILAHGWFAGPSTIQSAVSRALGYVAKMASHAIFQYNVLVIDDTHNTWTNMIVKIIILRLLGSSDAMVFWCRRESKPSQLIGTG